MQKIDITQFNDLAYDNNVPLFIVICGGIAVGKSHIVKKYITNPSYTTVDFDDFMCKYNYTDYSKSGSQWYHAMKETDELMTTLKLVRVPIISQGTGGSYKWLKFRLEDSRDKGYRTALLHIHAPLEQAYKQNSKRKEHGQHHVVDSQLHFIETSALRANCNFQVLHKEEPQLVDYICEYDNTLKN